MVDRRHPIRRAETRVRNELNIPNSLTLILRNEDVSNGRSSRIMSACIAYHQSGAADLLHHRNQIVAFCSISTHPAEVHYHTALQPWAFLFATPQVPPLPNHNTSSVGPTVSQMLRMFQQQLPQPRLKSLFLPLIQTARRNCTRWGSLTMTMRLYSTNLCETLIRTVWTLSQDSHTDTRTSTITTIASRLPATTGDTTVTHTAVRNTAADTGPARLILHIGLLVPILALLRILLRLIYTQPRCELRLKEQVELQVEGDGAPPQAHWMDGDNGVPVVQKALL